jgi:hypothetical protein
VLEVREVRTSELRQGIVRKPEGSEMSTVESRYQATGSEDIEDFMCAALQ